MIDNQLKRERLALIRQRHRLLIQQKGIDIDVVGGEFDEGAHGEDKQDEYPIQDMNYKKRSHGERH